MLQLTRYPGMAMSWLADTAIDTAGSQGAIWLRTLVPVNQIYTLVAVVIYSAVSIDAVLWMLPLLTFYLSFATLLIVTAQMLRSRKRLGDIKAIAGVLNRFTEVMFDADTAASAYSWKSLKPYAMYFVVLPVCVAALSAADAAWIPSPEIMALSGLASVTCFLALNDRYDKLAICSILIDVTFTSLLGSVKLIPEIPIIHSMLWYTVGPGYSLTLPVPGLHCMISLPSLAFCIVPFIFVGMAARRSWRGTYQILVPHLVCFFWWRLSVVFFGRSSWVGLARALVGWLGLIVMLPVLGVMLISYMFYVLFHAVSLAIVLKILTSLALVIGATSYAWWSRSGFRIGSRFSLEGKSPLSRAALLLVLVIGSCVPFAMFSPSSDKADLETLSISTYHQVCVQPGSNPTMCAHYTSAPVAGPGSVVTISVTRIENPAESFTTWLPGPAADWLRCAYGTRYPANCESITDSAELRDVCIHNTRRGRQCHLRDLDRYTYEVVVSVTLVDGSIVTIRMIADDWFREPASFIRPGHEVFFRAKLSDVVGANGLTLRLRSIECKNCDDVEAVKFSVRSSWHVMATLRTALHSVWNFFLNPLFVFV